MESKTRKPWAFEVCKACHRKNVASFRVSSRIWRLVMGEEQGVLCPNCFDDRAAEKDIDWTEDPVEFYPISTIANQRWGEIEMSGNLEVQA